MTALWHQTALAQEPKTRQSRDNNTFCAKQKLHPKFRNWSKLLDWYLVVVIIMADTFIYLQAALIMRNKSSENVSLPSYILLLLVSLSFLMYGLLWTDWILTLGSIVGTIGTILALVATLSYRPASHPGPFVLHV